MPSFKKINLIYFLLGTKSVLLFGYVCGSKITTSYTTINNIGEIQCQSINSCNENDVMCIWCTYTYMYLAVISILIRL